MRILIFYQHEFREGAAYKALAQYLSSKGLNIHITRSGLRLFLRILFYRPNIIVGPWVTPKLKKYLKRARLTPYLINTYEEQTQLIDDLQSEHVRQLELSHHLVAWNAEIAEKAREINDKLKIHLAGSLRHSYDFYREKILDRHFILDRYGIAPSDQLVFVAMDYAILFNDKRKEKALRLGLVDNEYLTISREVLDEFRDFLHKYSAIDRNSHFVIRPHPGTLVGQMEEYLQSKNLPNVSVIDDFGITDWLKISDKYLTRLSSSIVEAKLYNVPTCLIYRDITNRTIDSYHHIKNHEGEIASNSKELIDFIASKPLADKKEVINQVAQFDNIISENINLEIHRLLIEINSLR